MAERAKKSDVKKKVADNKKNIEKATNKITSSAKKEVKKEVKKVVKTVEEPIEKITDTIKEKNKKENKFVSFLKKNRTLLIVLFIIIALILGTIFSESNKTEEPAGDDIKSWYSTTLESDYVVTVIAMSTCGYCANYKPVITALANEKGFKLEWFEIDTLSTNDQQVLTTSYELENYSGGVPYTFITYGGEFVKDNVGYMPEEDTINFLTEAGVLK